jgi:putative ABC transport system permease protein
VVNETLAHSYFKDDDPIGKTIKFDVFDREAGTPHDAYFEIIGVIGDVRNQGLRDATVPEAYLPHTVVGVAGRAILVRTATDPTLMLATIRKEIWAVDSNIAPTDIGTLVGYLKEYSYATPRFGLIMMCAFAGVGLLLVVIGVFSVMAYTVSLQTHDIGVRMALGAQQENILRMILRNGFGLIATGVILGLLASVGLTRFLESQIWGVSATDPWTFSAVVVLILIVGLGACLVPAQFATRVDPLVALRYE